jgi:hypothetical protein
MAANAAASGSTRLHHQIHMHLSSHRPAHHLARVQIQHHR